MKILYSNYIRISVFAMMVAVGTVTGEIMAFTTDTYAENSCLASGRWVKISVPSTGLYMVSQADLRRWGFSDPSAVRVMGYGGQCIGDVLSRRSYVDDLVAAPQESTQQGVVFYGLGPETWSETTISGFTEFRQHTLNPYSTAGYYFLTDSSGDVSMPEEGVASAGDGAATTFSCQVFHESDLTSPGLSGFLFLGEDFRYTRTRSFNFDTPDAADNELRLQVKFGVNIPSGARLNISVNGTEIRPGEPHSISATSSGAYASLSTIREIVQREIGSRTTVSMTFLPGGTVNLAALDAINLSYNRALRLNGGSLCFTISTPEACLEGGDSDTRVWDVTDVISPKRMRTSAADGNISWTNSFGGLRTYAAWKSGATLPSPEFVENVANQNLHGEPVPDMVIFTPREWLSQAHRVAELHENSADSLRVLVVTDTEVFNEFSSGTPDAGAFRRLLKMMYDRGADGTHRLQHAMLFGRSTHDNRQVTQLMQALRERSLVGWSTPEGLRESVSYCSDDLLSMLEDDSGSRMVLDKYCIGVGRVPVGTSAEAATYVDKLYSYVNTSKPGPWKNHVILVADDGDGGVHLRQSEGMFKRFNQTESGQSMLYEKIYIDAYDEVGGASEIGRSLMHRNLEEGTVWWNYIGHANKQSLTSERLLTYKDFSTVKWRRLPFLYGATCSFLRWDGVDKSGSEIMLLNPKGGIIGALGATREVYISENEYFSNAVSEYAFRRDEKGRIPALGDIYRMAKNNVYYWSDKTQSMQLSTSTNKLRFQLMGDPAMRLAFPDMSIRVDSVNGEVVSDDSQPTLMARQRVQIRGAVVNNFDNSVVDDFSGQLTAVLYDAERSITTQGRPSDNTEGKQEIYDTQGNILFTGCGKVENGRVIIDFAMPEDVSDNFRPAALNLHALADNNREAISCFRNIYVYGYDETADRDSIPPVIDYAYLNHSTFKDGDAVNPSPMFIAKMTDNVGINLSQAGVGHNLSIRIDGRDSYSNLVPYYTPLSDGDAGGTLAYPLENLMPGHHELAFRVWDTSGNSTTHTMTFNVTDRISPEIFEVYTDANPATTEANFYISHNRPDADLTVKIEVFSLNGRLEWSSEETDRSDMFTSAPIRWNLCDQAGHRVPRGIYLYRATITYDGQTSQSETRRIAVTGG